VPLTSLWRKENALSQSILFLIPFSAHLASSVAWLGQIRLRAACGAMLVPKTPHEKLPKYDERSIQLCTGGMVDIRLHLRALHLMRCIAQKTRFAVEVWTTWANASSNNITRPQHLTHTRPDDTRRSSFPDLYLPGVQTLAAPCTTSREGWAKKCNIQNLSWAWALKLTDGEGPLHSRKPYKVPRASPCRLAKIPVSRASLVECSQVWEADWEHRRRHEEARCHRVARKTFLPAQI
jgi:hypothetical protein